MLDVISCQLGAGFEELADILFTNINKVQRYFVTTLRFVLQDGTKCYVLIYLDRLNMVVKYPYVR